MALGVYVLEVDWNNDGDYADAGENVSARTLAVDYQRGRDVASSLTGRSDAGRLKAVLNNESGDYSPFKASSPLTGNLLPGRRVRLRDTTGGANVILWTGFLDKITPTPSLRGLATAHLEAIGSLGIVAARDVNISMQANRRTDLAIGDVLDDCGWPAADRNLAVGKTTMTRWWGEGTALDALREIETTEGGFLKEDRDGKIAFEDRHYRLTDTEATTVQQTFSDAPGAALSYEEIEEEDPLPYIYNDFRAPLQLYTVGGLAVLWTLASSGGSSPGIFPGESVDFWALYPAPGVPSTNVAVDAWTTPVATTDYLANSAADGSGTNLTAQMVVTATKYAISMLVNIQNGATVVAYITFLQARGTPVARADTVEFRQVDVTSQTRYGKRTWPLDTGFLPNVQEALDWASCNLSLYKGPLPYIIVAFRPSKDAAARAALQGLDLSYRVALLAQNAAGLGIDEDFLVERMEHTIRPGLEEQVRLYLSPVSVYAGFWALDVGELGISTRLAY